MRARGIGHQAALRQLGNRLVAILHGCLKTNTTYNDYAELVVMPTGGAGGGVRGGQGVGVGDGRGIITGRRGRRGGCLWVGSVREVRMVLRPVPARVP